MSRPGVKRADIGVMKCSGSIFLTDNKSLPWRGEEAGAFKNGARSPGRSQPRVWRGRATCEISRSAVRLAAAQSMIAGGRPQLRSTSHQKYVIRKSTIHFNCDPCITPPPFALAPHLDSASPAPLRIVACQSPNRRGTSESRAAPAPALSQEHHPCPLRVLNSIPCSCNLSSKPASASHGGFSVPSLSALTEAFWPCAPKEPRPPVIRCLMPNSPRPLLAPVYVRAAVAEHPPGPPKIRFRSSFAHRYHLLVYSYHRLDP